MLNLIVLVKSCEEAAKKLAPATRITSLSRAEDVKSQQLKAVLQRAHRLLKGFFYGEKRSTGSSGPQPMQLPFAGGNHFLGRKASGLLWQISVTSFYMIIFHLHLHVLLSFKTCFAM